MDCFVPRNDVAHNVSLRGVLNLIEEAIREKTKNKLYILLININSNIMKKTVSHAVMLLLLAGSFFSCSKNEGINPSINIPNKNTNMNDDAMLGDNNIFLSCEQLLDTTGLNLYPFVPFTDEEWRMMSYDYKLERRQIPADFLQEMTTKELFYQFVYTDLAKSITLYNTIQLWFMATAQQLNMLPELLNRPNTGFTLLNILQQIDLANIEGGNCRLFYDYLQIIAGQSEVINHMTDKDIDNYILLQMRCLEIIQRLSKSKPYYWEGYQPSLSSITTGLGNAMIRYKFKPFMQLIEQDESGWWIRNAHNYEQYVTITIDCIIKFKNREK